MLCVPHEYNVPSQKVTSDETLTYFLSAWYDRRGNSHLYVRRHLCSAQCHPHSTVSVGETVVSTLGRKRPKTEQHRRATEFTFNNVRRVNVQCTSQPA